MEREEVPQAQSFFGENQRLAPIYHSQIWWVVVDSTNFEQGKLRRWISVHCIYKCLQPLDFGGLHDIDGLAVISIYTSSLVITSDPSLLNLRVVEPDFPHIKKSVKIINYEVLTWSIDQKCK